MDVSALTTTYNNLQRLSTSLDPADRHFVVAFSGGVDSTLLLLAAHQFCTRHDFDLSAIHVHHGLSPHADSWLEHCQTLCYSLGISLVSEYLTLKRQPRQSLEALARNGRYRVLLDYCTKRRGVLLLGHHVQDQLETVLLQLKRGAGPKGLASMSESQQRQGVTLLRPMLSLEKAAIEDAVLRNKIAWVDDESNHCNDFDRNFLRNQIIPLLTSRWPQFAKTAARSAALCAEQDAMLEEEIDTRLHTMLGNQGQLTLIPLRQQSDGWQRALIRAWLIGQEITVPSYAQLEQVRQIQYARNDAQPEVEIDGRCIRRFNDELYAVVPPDQPPDDVVQLSLGTFTPLPWLRISVMLQTVDQSDDKRQWSLRTGMPSVRIKPEGQSVSKPLKQWLKLWKVPVWERAGVAVIYCGEAPAIVLTASDTVVLEEFSELLKVKRKSL